MAVARLLSVKNLETGSRPGYERIDRRNMRLSNDDKINKIFADERGKETDAQGAGVQLEALYRVLSCSLLLF